VPNGTDREIHEMLVEIIRSLADSPADVGVELISDENGAVFRVEANQADVGRLIGKGGQTARALQAIANANASRSGRRFQIEFDRALDR
jgi:predicted RNA-binding protein YlqC (UPF0109 family)